MNVIRCLTRRAWLVPAVAILVGQACFAAPQTVLIDFGSDTSYRGLDVTNPDSNGNHWNSVQPGLFVPDLVDIDSNETTIDLGWDTDVGTDSYNGPAGATDDTDEFGLEDDLARTDIDAEALGNLGGALAGPFDFASGYDGTDHFTVRFQIQGLNPTATYDLTFFGSHSFSNDSTTIYTVYSDDTYSTSVATTSLLIQEPFNVPNRDRIATINGVSPQAGNILYIEFVGENGFGGYLNDMQLVGSAATLNGDYNDDGKVDGADLTVWKGDFGKVQDGLMGDGDADGDADGDDFLIWQRNFGAPPPAIPAAGAVPEPVGLVLLLVGSLALRAGGLRGKK